ncbi:SURP and G-patch domain-containing protein 1 [Gonapodya sp. JEL0774]|nr:SURP and G-patch domain-containing protein 1 [Gonapodya sp. JEL0774]
MSGSPGESSLKRGTGPSSSIGALIAKLDKKQTQTQPKNRVILDDNREAEDLPSKSIEGTVQHVSSRAVPSIFPSYGLRHSTNPANRDASSNSISAAEALAKAQAIARKFATPTPKLGSVTATEPNPTATKADTGGGNLKLYTRYSTVYQPGMVRVYGEVWSWPEDEIVGEEGTVEHKRRKEEMERTSSLARSLTERGEALHEHRSHLGGYLPPEELARFEAMVHEVKARRASSTEANRMKEYIGDKSLSEDSVGLRLPGTGLGWEGQGNGSAKDLIGQSPRGNSRGERPDEVTEEDDDFDLYRKRMMLSYRYRPNPFK